MYKMDLALNNQQWLMCHKTKPTKSNMLGWKDQNKTADKSENSTWRDCSVAAYTKTQLEEIDQKILARDKGP